MKKLYKILLGSLMSVLLFIATCFPVSALSVSNSPNNNGLKTDTISIKVEGYSPAQDWAVTVDGSDSGGGMSKYVVYTSDYSPIPANTSFTVTAYIKADTTYVNDKYYCYGNYSFATRRNSGYEITKVNESYRYYQGENYLFDCYQSADVVEETIIQDFPSVKSTFNTQSLGAKFDTYVVSFDVIIPTQTNALIFYLYAVSFEMIDPATSAIIDNQNENTDKLLNGDTDLDSSGETDKVNGTIGGIDDKTSAALGGKSDEEIQAELENSLNPDKIGLDFTKANRISTFFDNTLTAFGSGYKTLLLLSLTLGLAAFLIGRRYG